MKHMMWLGLVLSALLLAGCGEPTIDGSSMEAFKASVEEIRDELPEDKEFEFQKALTLLMVKKSFSALTDSLADAMGQGKNDGEDKTVLEQLDGLDADEVIALANKKPEEDN